ncbi:hypothetical protein AB0M95_39035 [Sphaerisporangium sp. NPDC051017]|uniref:hypothetical protein n=1 Tax=Sphaerisporangium sp. NPDC051017 TaxID=3154636 RepID=UPI00342DB0D2
MDTIEPSILSRAQDGGHMAAGHCALVGIDLHAESWGADFRSAGVAIKGRQAERHAIHDLLTWLTGSGQPDQ